MQRVLRRVQGVVYDAFAAAYPPRRGQRVLDLGVNASLADRDGYFFERRYPYPEQVVACGLEGPDIFGSLFPEIEYVQSRRGEPLPFSAGRFDVVFCNAVIEHVGSRARQHEFLGEILRIGHAAFVTTPNRWYPVELHTMLPLVHYLPAPAYRAVIRRLGFDFFSREENLNLLDYRSLRAILPHGIEAEFTTLRFLGLPSNIILTARRV